MDVQQAVRGRFHDARSIGSAGTGQVSSVRRCQKVSVLRICGLLCIEPAIRDATARLSQGAPGDLVRRHRTLVPPDRTFVPRTWPQADRKNFRRWDRKGTAHRRTVTAIEQGGPRGGRPAGSGSGLQGFEVVRRRSGFSAVQAGVSSSPVRVSWSGARLRWNASEDRTGYSMVPSAASCDSREERDCHAD